MSEQEQQQARAAAWAIHPTDSPRARRVLAVATWLLNRETFRLPSYGRKVA